MSIGTHVPLNIIVIGNNVGLKSPLHKEMLYNIRYYN